MCQQSQLIVEEEYLKTNVFKTVYYLFEAVCEEDYETVDLELEDLNAAVKRLRVFQVKKERSQQLADLVKAMQERGIKIDFAKRVLFLKNSEKNAVGKSRFVPNLDRKKQQA